MVQLYQGLASSLAQQHGMKYPQGLERVMVDRLQKLKEAGRKRLSSRSML